MFDQSVGYAPMMKFTPYSLLAVAILAVLVAGPLAGLQIGVQVALAVALFMAAWLLGTGPQTSTPDPAEIGHGNQAALPAGFGRELLRQMPAALIMISETERITYANPAARQLLPSITSGAHITSVIRAPAFIEAVETVLSERQDLRFTFTMIGQSERFFEARAAFLPPNVARELGEIGQIIIQIEDRTRDKALLQTRTDFIANASHELRTPLASILGYIETLQGHARDDPEAREMFLDIMLRQANRMKRLVDDLMSLSRIEMNAHVAPEDDLDLHAVVVEAASGLFPVATQNDVLLQIELPLDSSAPMVRGDRDQLAQVISNLVDNAIKYGGRGNKVRVTSADTDPRYPGRTGVSVIDQGPGISRENIPRLTERFFRVSASQSKDMGGTGLGLAITKHILARHGGALDIKSTLGEGSRFTVWIPELQARDRQAAE